MTKKEATFLPRPKRCRRICRKPKVSGFCPDGKPSAETVTLSLDEFEAIRLVDYEGKIHGECAALMDVSRTTVTEIYETARRKIADALVNGKRLEITGGNYRFCGGSARACCGKPCRFVSSAPQGSKGESLMKIAVTYEPNGQIFQHFAHTKQFKLYEVTDHTITKVDIVPTLGSGHGALAGFLQQYGVDVLICGGIGGGAQAALAEAGIRLYGGVQGSADAAVAALLDGSLDYNPNVHCNHHDHEHGEGGHTCGSHGCGHHSCH